MKTVHLGVTAVTIVLGVLCLAFAANALAGRNGVCGLEANKDTA